MLIETHEYLKNRVSALEAKVAAVDSQAETIRILNSRIEGFKSEIKEFVINNLGGNVSDDELRELAENFGIEMMQNVSFTVTASFNVNATVPLGTDVDDLAWSIANDLEGSLEYNGNDIGNFDWDTPDFEVADVEAF